MYIILGTQDPRAGRSPRSLGPPGTPSKGVVIMKFYILDERDVWHEALSRAARAAGYNPQRIKRGLEATERGVGFIRPHATPEILQRNQADYWQMAGHCVMIQDRRQVELYENKTAQWVEWGNWMPETWRFDSKDDALHFADHCAVPVVSKADQGASSVNVRILHSRDALVRHIEEAFGPGIRVQHCDSKGTTSLQRGYVLLQRFIPHDTTYRVNIIGGGRAIFKRYNYPDRPVAQTGNVEPVTKLDDLTESLLWFADRFSAEANTKWCALDILRDGDEWRLLETSLAWPWPSPGACMDAPIFRTNYKWADLFDCLMTEVSYGEWGNI